MQQPFKADKVLIGKVTNLIDKSPEGDMVFRDTFVPGVKLKDLLSGGPIVIEPAILVQVEEDDWTVIVEAGQALFNIDIPLPWLDLADPIVEINIWDTNNEEVSVNKKQFKQTSVLIQSTVKIDLQVVIKRL